MGLVEPQAELQSVATQIAVARQGLVADQQEMPKGHASGSNKNEHVIHACERIT